MAISLNYISKSHKLFYINIDTSLSSLELNFLSLTDDVVTDIINFIFLFWLHILRENIIFFNFIKSFTNNIPRFILIKKHQKSNFSSLKHKNIFYHFTPLKFSHQIVCTIKYNARLFFWRIQLNLVLYLKIVHSIFVTFFMSSEFIHKVFIAKNFGKLNWRNFYEWCNFSSKIWKCLQYIFFSFLL